MALLWIDRIDCHTKSDNTGSDDEIYLRIGGNKVWPGDGYYDIQKGKQVNVRYSVTFEANLTVDLMEYDPNSNDDLLGSITVNRASQGSFVAKAEGDGGSYDIHYEVRPR